MTLKHHKVPLFFYYDYKDKVIRPLEPSSTPEQRLHQYIGYWDEDSE